MQSRIVGLAPAFSLFPNLNTPHKTFTFHQILVLIITFTAYASFHASRKPPSIVKSVLGPPSLNSSSIDNGWAPFNGTQGTKRLGELDLAFLSSYALGMYFAGHLGDRIDLRYFLVFGMMGSGILTLVFGLGYWMNVHTLGFYMSVQIVCGLFQSIGWPCVVSVVGNWCGKEKRGLIMGLWNSHTSVGNILGSVRGHLKRETNPSSKIFFNLLLEASPKMAITSSRTTRSNGSASLRSKSPSGRFCGVYSNRMPSSSPSSSGFASSTSSSFSSPSTAFFSSHNQNNHHQHRSASPTRVNLFTSAPMTQSFRYSIDNRSISPNRSIAVSSNKPSNHHKIPDSRRRCMCSPTTHPGSFRCSLHKNVANPHGQGTASYTTNGLNMRRSAMTNSLVRIGGVEGEWVRRALTTLIRPSSHQLKRRSAYEPRRSRLASMSKAEDL